MRSDFSSNSSVTENLNNASKPCINMNISINIIFIRASSFTQSGEGKLSKRLGRKNMYFYILISIISTCIESGRKGAGVLLII